MPYKRDALQKRFISFKFHFIVSEWFIQCVQQESSCVSRFCGSDICLGANMEILFCEIFIFFTDFWAKKLTSDFKFFQVQMLSDANGGYVQWSLAPRNWRMKPLSHRCIGHIWGFVSAWSRWRWACTTLNGEIYDIGMTGMTNCTFNIQNQLLSDQGPILFTWQISSNLEVFLLLGCWVRIWLKCSFGLGSVSFGKLRSCQNLWNLKEEGCQPVLFSKRRMEECGIAWTREGAVVICCERTGPASTQNHTNLEGYQVHLEQPKIDIVAWCFSLSFEQV